MKHICKFCGKEFSAAYYIGKKDYTCGKCSAFCMKECPTASQTTTSWHKEPCISCEHNPYTPWYTIELGKAYPGKQMMIRQCKGYKNNNKISKPQKVVDFEAEFSEFIKNPKKYKKAHERKKSA